jgi:mercuric ion transport protein
MSRAQIERSRLSDRALIATGLAGSILAAICCATPLLVAIPPLASFGAWMAGVGLAAIPLIMIAGVALVVWRHHHRPAKRTGWEPKAHKEDARP